MSDVETSYEWAVRVHTSMGDVPGPHLLECSSETDARFRLSWWRNSRPEGGAELLRRTVMTTREEWETA